MNNLVSVIIPVYNREEYITECLNSVFEQSYQNFEIILVDDGSTDSTFDICNSLAQKDNRVKLFAGKHGGVSVARNLALDKASGEYIFFLDSDDVIHPFLLEALVNGIEENNVSISATEIINIPEANWNTLDKIKERYTPPAELNCYTHQETMERLFAHRKSPLHLIGGVMFKRNYIESTRFNTDVYIGEDFLFIYENLIKGSGAAFLKQKWYYCRHHKNNSSLDYSFNGFYTRFLRRELVWKNEEKAVRIKYANLQKINLIFVFSNCLEKSGINSEAGKKMCRFMKKNKSIIKSLPLKDKLHYFAVVYTPKLYYFILKMYKNKLKKSKIKKI